MAAPYWRLGERARRLQWRDRAGFRPASLLPSRSGRHPDVMLRSLEAAASRCQSARSTMAGSDENDGRRDRRRHLRPVRGARPPQARTALRDPRGERPLRRGDPHRDGGRLPARSRPRLDAGAEAARHRAVSRARPRRASRADQPRAAHGLCAPPAGAARASGRDAARGAHAGAADAAEPASPGPASCAWASISCSPAAADTTTSRSRRSCAAASGRRRSTAWGSRCSRGSTRATRSGSRSSPPSRACASSRGRVAVSCERLGEGPSTARAKRLRRPSTRCAAVWLSW